MVRTGLQNFSCHCCRHSRFILRKTSVLKYESIIKFLLVMVPKKDLKCAIYNFKE